MGVGSSTQAEMRLAYRVTVAKPEGKGPFERSGHKAENNVKNGLGRIM
jgi:hypothetical protein